MHKPSHENDLFIYLVERIHYEFKQFNPSTAT